MEREADARSRRIRRRDAMALNWAEIYQNTYQDLVRFLHRKVWDEERARDLAQEAFVRALRHCPPEPRPWLFRVAANLAADEARLVVRRKRHLALLRSDAGATAPAPPDPAEEFERNRRLDIVQRALDSLSERDREVLLLWDAGLKYTEIAAQVGIAVGSVGTTLARARRRLAAACATLEEIDAARG